MARVFLVVMDSVGIGGAPDAADFYNDGLPDTGANTFGHIAEALNGVLNVPNLAALGLGRAVKLASGLDLPEFDVPLIGAFGAATEVSIGKDTPTGHWELSGVPVPWDWHVFPNEVPAFPDHITRLICELSGTETILGNCYASGTGILEEHGEEHMKTGAPICYTSVDSVLQIAAHEETFGLDRLLKLCERLAPHLHEMKVGRVIARPFLGRSVTDFKRTPHRKDYAITPPVKTLCDYVSEAGRKVHAIGKIGDIFSMRGIDDVQKGTDVRLMDHLVERADHAVDGAFIFANFVEFDSLYGHRRDVEGYARHLEWFDREIGQVLARLKPDDLLIITADHGNDPTWHGTDHTRERVPVLMHGPAPRSLGHIGFVDVAASVAAHLDAAYGGEGKSVL